LKRSEWPSPPPVFTYQKVNVFEDMPWPNHSFYIASSRLRVFLESEAPGAAQYLPVRFAGPRSTTIPQKYWAMNWLRVFDCLDEASYNEDKNGKFVEVPIIDRTRIPEDAVLGIVKGYQFEVIIRNDLRLKIEKAGLLGPQFYRIAHRDGTDFKPFMKPDHFASSSEVSGGGGDPAEAERHNKLPLNLVGKRKRASRSRGGGIPKKRA